MTTVSQIITDAYRESNINAIGVSPSALQVDESLRLLNRLIASSYGNDSGENLKPLGIGNNGIVAPPGFPYYIQGFNGQWIIPPNYRVFLNLTASQTIYLSPQPMDGQRFAYVDKSSNLSTYPLTIIANGRTIGGLASTVINTNGANAEYTYRDDIGDWAIVSPLSINDEMPFPMDFDDYWVIGLAMRLNPRNGPTLDPQSQAVYRMVKNDFVARYRQKIEVRSELGLIRTPGVRYDYYNQADVNNQQFLLGYPGIWGPY